MESGAVLAKFNPLNQFDFTNVKLHCMFNAILHVLHV